MACFLNDTVFAKATNDCGDLSCVFVGQVFAQIGVFESADHEFTAQDNGEQLEVVAVEQVEAAVGAVVGAYGFGHFVESFDAVDGVVDGGEELDVASVGVVQELDEVFDAVDTFLHRRELSGGSPVAVYYLAVVFEKGDVVGRRLDTQHDAVFVVHFYCGLSHVVFDTGSLDTCVKIVAYLTLVICVEISSEKRSDVVGFDGVGSGANQLIIKGREILLAFEHDVGGVFDLHEAPMVSVEELANDGAVASHGPVQKFVQAVGTHGIGELLGGCRIRDLDESVVEHFVVDAVLVQFSRQFVMAVEVKLQTKGCPGGYAQIAQAQLWQDEIEIIVQALARCILEKGFMCFLVVPRMIGRTRFHRREDMHQSRMVSAFGDDGFDAFLFAEILLCDEVDFQVIVLRNGFGVLAQRFAQLIGPLGKIEDADAVRTEPAGCGARISDIHHGAGNDHTVVTRKRKGNFICMAFCKVTHANSMKQNRGQRHLPEKMAA